MHGQVGRETASPENMRVSETARSPVPVDPSPRLGCFSFLQNYLVLGEEPVRLFKVLDLEREEGRTLIGDTMMSGALLCS